MTAPFTTFNPIAKTLPANIQRGDDAACRAADRRRLSLRQRLAMLVALVTLGAATPVRADDSRYFLQFEGTWLGVFGVGELTLDAFVGTDAYQSTAHVRSSGVAALFDRTHLSGVSSGPLSAAGPEWGTYSLDHNFAAKRRVTQMRAGPNGVETLVTPAYRSPGVPGTTQAERDGARDPLTTLIAMGLEVGRTWRCTGAFSVFDGRLHYRLALAPAGFQRRHIQGGYDGPALKCTMRLTPLSGYDADERREARSWPAAEVWFGLIEGARFAPPVYIKIPFAIGDVALTLKTYQTPRVALEVLEP